MRVHCVADRRARRRGAPLPGCVRAVASAMWRARSSILAALFTRLASGITLGSGVTIVPRDVLFSGAVFSAGDVIAQRLSMQPKGAEDDAALVPVDGLRAMSACILGFLYGGGFLPVVYQLAEKWVPGRGAKAVLIKAAAVTAVCSSMGNYASMMWRRCSAPSNVPGESLRARAARCARSVNRDFLEVFVADWCVWPLYDALNFGVIPPRLRPLCTTVVATVWHISGLSPDVSALVLPQ